MKIFALIASLSGFALASFDVDDGSISHKVRFRAWMKQHGATAVGPTPPATRKKKSHYGDPNDGDCLKHEIDMKFPNIPGSICSPKCTVKDKCPTDVPAGVTALPECTLSSNGEKYCGLVCVPSLDEASLRAGDRQCSNNASCKTVPNSDPPTGLCTYDDTPGPGPTPPAPSPAPTPPAPVNPHYEDPNGGGCRSDEIVLNAPGVRGFFCSPKCSDQGQCPTDVPAGVTAKPECALKDPSGNGDRYCALICSPSLDEASLRAGDAQCSTNASCKAMPNSSVGVCTYDDRPGPHPPAPSPGPTPPAPVNPHYEDPNGGGCRSDEIKVKVPTVSGSYCAPQCGPQSACPTDVPAGVTAKPACSPLENYSRCALFCSVMGGFKCPANASCKSVPHAQTINLCTYDS